MGIPVDRARRVVAEAGLQDIATLFAQTHAKHVLQEVREAPENFPAFDSLLDDKVTFAAYALLASGCSIIEAGNRAEGAIAVERAASLLQYVHAPSAGDSKGSAFHVLVAGMAFYAAGHYSRAFVTIRLIENQTAAAGIVAAFIRKDVPLLIRRLNAVLLSLQVEFTDQVSLDEWAITTAIARAVAMSLEFIFTGPADTFGVVDQQLSDAALVASTSGSPALWWTARLVRLMLGELAGASPRAVLAPLFGTLSGSVLEKYIRLLAFAKRPVSELWTSQRIALPLALDLGNRGAVINLRTSAGKTQVAELAMLQALIAKPGGRVLYLAPFRSLALEVERTLTGTLGCLGYAVSHLYGGSRISAVDTELVSESSIVIATPEKARALFRAAPELLESLALVVVDEGHLIGASERYVRNELFVDHLRTIAQSTGARLLLLSAVLPNPQDVAAWVTSDSAAVARSTWKPSAERFGLLRWNGSVVRIDWKGEVASFNPRFVEPRRIGGRRRRLFPNDKNEAIAAAAVKLAEIGPVMIFSGRAVSVPTLARAVLLALGGASAGHDWPAHEWQVFKAVCEEELAPDAIELEAARAGIICHSNRLTAQVRHAIEHLMRSAPPKVIIATTTLAQGVNVGVSSVIIATPYISQRTISRRDFWNICGRAGRAFVDGEGKILYAIDHTQQAWQVRKDEGLAQAYFDAEATDRVESGVLFVVRRLREVAQASGVAFELLTELAANNDFTLLGARGPAFANVCDLIDDELLALHCDPTVNPSGGPVDGWIESVFRTSLAVLQARDGPSAAEATDVIAFLRARALSTLQRVPEGARRAVVSSSLPLSAALRAYDMREMFAGIAADYLLQGSGPRELEQAVKAIERWTRENAKSVAQDMPDEVRLDQLRPGWCGGAALRLLSVVDEDAPEIVREFYGYQLPWIVHAASQQLRISGNEAAADALARVSLLVELGVPSEAGARIFLAGVRSRTAATELAATGIDFGDTLQRVRRSLRDRDLMVQVRAMVSPAAAQWLDLVDAESRRDRSTPVPNIPAFSFSSHLDADVLHVRRGGGGLFLTTTDGSQKVAVESTDDFPFEAVADDPRVAFRRSERVWQMEVRDPRLSEYSDWFDAWA